MELLYGQAQQGGGLAAFLPFILIMFIIYFLMIRPQTKRQKEKQKMREDLQKGNKGFKEKGRQVIIKVDNNTNITINRTAIAGLAEQIKDEELEQT